MTQGLIGGGGGSSKLGFNLVVSDGKQGTLYSLILFWIFAGHTMFDGIR
jgi:hypothetical protein